MILFTEMCHYSSSHIILLYAQPAAIFVKRNGRGDGRRPGTFLIPCIYDTPDISELSDEKARFTSGFTPSKKQTPPVMSPLCLLFAKTKSVLESENWAKDSPVRPVDFQADCQSFIKLKIRNVAGWCHSHIFCTRDRLRNDPKHLISICYI
jgi:hypothetical protein